MSESQQNQVKRSASPILMAAHHLQNLINMLIVLFVGLKLTGHIDWNWFWVTSPITLPIILFFSIIVGSYILRFILRLIRGRQQSPVVDEEDELLKKIAEGAGVDQREIVDRFLKKLGKK